MKKSGRPKQLSAADDQYLKVTFLRSRKKSGKDITQDLRDTSGTSVDPFMFHKGLNGRVDVPHTKF